MNNASGPVFFSCLCTFLNKYKTQYINNPFDNKRRAVSYSAEVNLSSIGKCLLAD